MKGGIYTDQKCDVCGATLKDAGRKKLCCPETQRFLTGLRSETNENSFDERDFSSKKPLGFQNPAGKWLDMKKETVKPSSCRNPHNSIMKARNAWGNAKMKNSSAPFFYCPLFLHQTNKAFERYFRVGADDIRKIYQETSIQKQTSVTNLKRPLRNK